MEPLKFCTTTVQTPPKYLKASGKDLWTSTLDEWALSDSDLIVLVTACQCADRLTEIRGALDADGIMVTDPSGRQRSHPLLAAESQVHGILLRAWNQLSLDGDEQPKIGRPVTRG